MKYLVLGSSGTIGSVLCAHLRQCGHEVATFDIKQWKEMDLRHPNHPLLSAVRWADFVMFLAFDVGGAKYLQSRASDFNFIDDNVRIMENVFSQLRSSGKPFIFASSQMAEVPFTPYGALKRLGEHYTRALGGISARLWNVYGNEPVGERSHVIPDFIHAAKTHRRIEMITTGEEKRQFVHVQDCAEALLQLSVRFYEWPKEQPACIASGQWESISDVARTIAVMTGPDVVVIPGTKTDPATEQRATVAPTPNPINFWQPTISLSDGIKKMMP